MSPRSSAVTRSGVVRNVTIVTSMLAVDLNSTADRCWVLPGAMVPKLSLPGLRLAAATMSSAVLSGPVRLGGDQEIEPGQDRDRPEVFQHVIGHRLEQRLADRGAVAGQRQRVAVRRGGGAGLGGDDAAGAGPVVDHELLAEALLQLLGHQARGDVGDAARPVGHDDADRTVGIPGLRLRRNGRGHRQEKQPSADSRERSQLRFRHGFHPRLRCHIHVR